MFRESQNPKWKSGSGLLLWSQNEGIEVHEMEEQRRDGFLVGFHINTAVLQDHSKSYMKRKVQGQGQSKAESLASFVCGNDICGRPKQTGK